jgi:hypothetical protein
MHSQFPRMAALAGVLVLSLLIAGSGVVRAAQPTVQDTGKKITTMMLDATAQRDYAKFVEDGTPQFKAAITKAQFDAVCSQVSDVLKAGYTLAFVNQSSAQGFDVTLWRVKFAKGGSMLAQASIKDGLVGGFLLKPDTGQ